MYHFDVPSGFVINSHDVFNFAVIGEDRAPKDMIVSPVQ